ncbi:Uncharacterised protein [Enterobacter hormaechei]|nr:Uncharacterised protein [Enterobacter hormaechei]
MYWTSSVRDLALSMSLLHWLIPLVIAENPELESHLNYILSIFSLSMVCDTSPHRQLQRAIKNLTFYSHLLRLTTILYTPKKISVC